MDDVCGKCHQETPRRAKLGRVKLTQHAGRFTTLWGKERLPASHDSTDTTPCVFLSRLGKFVNVNHVESFTIRR